MKIRKAMMIQCAILVLILSAEIIFADRYRVSYPMEQAEDADLQEEAGSCLSEENGVSGLQDGEESSDIGNFAESEMQYPVYQIDDKAGIFLLAEMRGDKKENFLYQYGKSGEPLQVLYGEIRSCEDINFDGYPDIKIFDSRKAENSYFLWDERKRQFVEAVSDADETGKVYIERKLDNFRTFWGYQNIRDDYRETGEGSGEFYWSFTAVCWEGKSYICRNEVNFDKRMKNGLVLEGYQDRKLVETVSLNLVPGKPETAVVSCQKGYQEMAEKERLKAQEIFEETEEGDIVRGDAEQETEEKFVFSCDIDNDGAEECYKKWFWWPSTTSSVSHVEFEIEKETEEAEETVIERAISENTEKRGAPIMLWADSYQGENIVNVMYHTGLYDYVVEGYLAKDQEHYRSLYLIEKTSKREVEEVRDWKYSG